MSVTIPNILAIETGGQQCQLGLLNPTGRHTATRTIQSHSQVILELVDALLAQHSVSLQRLEAIAVNIGPGSFTGVRVGVSCAQGLAFALSIPVIPLCSLEVMALAACIAQNRSATVDCQLDVFAAIDARMSQVYAAWYRVRQSLKSADADLLASWSIDALHSPQVLYPEALPALEASSVGTVAIRTGSGNVLADRFPESYRQLPLLSQRGVINDDNLATTSSGAEADIAMDAMLQMAHRKFLDGHAIDPEALQPQYTRDQVVSR